MRSPPMLQVMTTNRRSRCEVLMEDLLRECRNGISSLHVRQKRTVVQTMLAAGGDAAAGQPLITDCADLSLNVSDAAEQLSGTSALRIRADVQVEQSDCAPKVCFHRQFEFQLRDGRRNAMSGRTEQLLNAI